jgi:beta-N-acetylhexosaminidase
LKSILVFAYCLLTNFSPSGNPIHIKVPAPVRVPLADSLDLKIGQMILFGFYGTTPDKALKTEIASGRLGGILIYERNLTPKKTAASLKVLVQQCQASASIKLFVSIDHEGGLVNRLKTKYGFPDFPSAEYLGRLNNPDSTKWYCDDAAFTQSRLGINLNYAPVVDVKNVNCPVLGARERCFSENTDIISQQAEEVVKSHNYFGVATTLKHFPGHGNSTTDSHFGVADVSRTWKPEELEPYRVLLKKGLVNAVLTAHIVNDKLDGRKLPATLSDRMINGLLRDSLGFQGVVFSDDMQMQAISSHYGFEESIELAINAGIDVLMFSNNILGVGKREPAEVHAIVKKLVQNGKISLERINLSYRRIMQLKAEKHIDNQ